METVAFVPRRLIDTYAVGTNCRVVGTGVRLCYLWSRRPADPDRADQAFVGLAKLRQRLLSLPRVRAVFDARSDPLRASDDIPPDEDRDSVFELSMGMSGDLEKAVACGSTQVRIGTAIFGRRPPIQE